MEGGRKERLLKLAATVPKPMIKIRKVCVVDLLETTMPLIPKKRQRCHSKSEQPLMQPKLRLTQKLSVRCWFSHDTYFFYAL